MREPFGEMYEIGRQLLVNADSLLPLINKVKNREIRQRFSVMNSTFQADFMLFLELLIEIMNCIDEDESNLPPDNFPQIGKEN